MSDTPKDDEDFTLSAEIMDRAERKALREKAKLEAKEKAKKLEPTQDEIEAALANRKFIEAEKAKKKKLLKGVIAFLVFVFLFWAIDSLFTPYKAGMTFGICRTYLELNVQFPQDLRISTIEDFGEYIRIWYTQLDAFGEYRMENIQCHFRADEVTGAAVEKILINRREIDPEKVALFNASIPVILQNPPDLTIPAPLPNSLENLQINTDAFRFQLNLPGKLGQ